MDPGQRPHVFMIAGPNGAGKTSTAMALLPKLHLLEFINADEIARGLSPLNPRSTALDAGKLMLKRIAYLTLQKQHFAFETTAAGKVHIKTLQQCHKAGYSTHLIFLYLTSPQLAMERVKTRVSRGGHNVPENDIIRRYNRGLKNLMQDYIHLVDNVKILDNSTGAFSPIAQKIDKTGWHIDQPEIWETLKEEYEHAR